MKKINWLDHLVNLIVVVSGISLAFTLNSWKAGKDLKKVEKEYLVSLIKDLDRDILDLDSLITEDTLQLSALAILFQFDKNAEVSDSTSWALGQLGTFNSFEAHNTTYESLKFSGKMETLWDLELRVSILENYHTAYNQIAEIEEYYQKNYDGNILPFFIDELSSGSILKDKLSDSRFRSIVGLQISFLQQKIQAYNRTRKISKGLREQLLKKLQKI